MPLIFFLLLLFQLACNQFGSKDEIKIFVSDNYNFIIKQNDTLEFINQKQMYVAPDLVCIVNDSIDLSSFHYCVPSAANEYQVRTHVNINNKVLKLTSNDSCFNSSTKHDSIYKCIKDFGKIDFDSIIIETYEEGTERKSRVFRSNQVFKLNQTKYLQLPLYILHNPFFNLCNSLSSHGRNAKYTMFYNGNIISIKQTTYAPHYLYGIYKFSE